MGNLLVWKPPRFTFSQNLKMTGRQYRQTFVLSAIDSNCRCRIVLPERLIAIAETVVLECRLRISRCRYNFSLEFHLISHGQSSTEGCFSPPEPEFGAEFWEANFGRLNFGVEFLGRFFCLILFQQSGLRNIHAQESHLRNSLLKIKPRNGAKKFTLHFCRAMWLMISITDSSSSTA